MGNEGSPRTEEPRSGTIPLTPRRISESLRPPASHFAQASVHCGGTCPSSTLYTSYARQLILFLLHRLLDGGKYAFYRIY